MSDFATTSMSKLVVRPLYVTVTIYSTPYSSVEYLVFPLATVIASRFTQLPNASSPMLMTLEEMLTEVIKIFPQKAFASIEVTLYVTPFLVTLAEITMLPAPAP